MTDRHKILDSETHYYVVRDSETWVEFAETSQFSEDDSTPLQQQQPVADRGFSEGKGGGRFGQSPPTLSNCY